MARSSVNQIPAHRWTWPARVVRVVDGDTIDVELDAGFRAVRSERLRLLGVNAPEMVGKDKARGLTSKEFVILWFRDTQDEELRHPRKEGWPLLIETHQTTDSFGRYLAVVWRRVDGACLNDDLISSGNAVEDIR